MDPAINLARWQTIFSGLVAFFTLCYVFINAFQLLAMRRALEETRRSNANTAESNRIAERSLLLGRRAWLIPRIDRRSPTDPTETLGGRRLIVWISNTGGMPGKITSAGGNMKAGKPSGDEVEISCHPHSAIVSPSTANGEDPFLTFPVEDFTGREMNFKTGAEVLYAACRINYIDAFEKQFYTEMKWFRGREGKWYTLPTGSTFT